MNKPESTETDETRPAQAVPTSPQGLDRGGPSLGKRLKIRSMVTVAGEVLPFFWPMRNFIHHNPLHGLEYLRFEEAVTEATRLFHARGYLKRIEYQQLMARGSIAPDVVEDLVAEFVTDWLAEHDSAADTDLADLLNRSLVAMLTQMSQPAPGDEMPCAEEVLAGMKRGA
ncbi:MAG: putative inorganic carbon transporter subunit DabA [Thiohalocapsa sp.]